MNGTRRSLLAALTILADGTAAASVASSFARKARLGWDGQSPRSFSVPYLDGSRRDTTSWYDLVQVAQHVRLALVAWATRLPWKST